MSSVLTMLAPNWPAKAYAQPKTRAPAAARAQDAAVNSMVTAMDATANRTAEQMDRDDLKEVLGKTLEVVDLLAPRRHLKYEVIDEADLVQVQVIDTDDGNVVRKIPADEIIELVKQIHKTLSKRLDESIDVTA